MNLFERWQHTLDDLHSRGRFRTLTPPTGIDFSSNDYLGYAEIFWTDAPLSRSGAASRSLRGHREIWERVEADLAHWHKCERVLMMNSGYVANEGLLATVIAPTDWVASDQFNHASIIDGLKLSRAERWIYRHLDVNQLEEGLKTAHQVRGDDRQLFVVTESLFGMDGDVAPLIEIAEVCKRYQAHLIVDEAHATGCIGADGSGFVGHFNLRAEVLATVHTGGKALGVPGAYLAGSRRLVEFLINRCRHLIFTTALPPVLAHWWLQSIAKVRGDSLGRANLHANAKRFRDLIAEHVAGISANHYIVPIQIGEDSRAIEASRALAADGFDLRAIRPPTVPEGTARLRVSIHADRTEQEIDGAVAAIQKVIPADRSGR